MNVPCTKEDTLAAYIPCVVTMVQICNDKTCSKIMPDWNHSRNAQTCAHYRAFTITWTNKSFIDLLDEWSQGNGNKLSCSVLCTSQSSWHDFPSPSNKHSGCSWFLVPQTMLTIITWWNVDELCVDAPQNASERCGWLSQFNWCFSWNLILAWIITQLHTH